jgi:hypothetical protein
MSQETVESLMDHWINDPDFRVSVQEDIRCALSRIGANLTEAEFSTVQRLFNKLAKGAAPSVDSEPRKNSSNSSL